MIWGYLKKIYSTITLEDNPLEPLTFITLDHDGEGRLTEKMSRFLSFAFHVSSPQQAKEKIKQYANLYHDARHVCWAYMVGPYRTEFLVSDNGEPSGTAGKPILGQINSLGLTDVLVIVVRYFGGIKLGTPGLIAAYREAARLALDNAGVKSVTRTATIKLSAPYASVDPVMRIIKEKNLPIIKSEMGMNCSFLIDVPLSLMNEVRMRLSSLSGVSLAS